MRLVLIKVITFLAVFMFMQGVILPWTISNNFMPLWADIILIALILLMWVIVIDRISHRLMGRFKDES